MKDVMVDIETLGTRPTSVMTQLGACYFDRKTGEIGNKFLYNINIGSALMVGLTIDTETIEWWKGQYILGQDSWIYDTVNLAQVLNAFDKFISDNEIDGVWSHATFDMPILAYNYSVYGMKMPFNFRKCRDIRTIVDLANLSKK